MLERGLGQLGTIRLSVIRLSKAIAAGHLPIPPELPSVRPDSLYDPADAVLSVQRIAGAIAAVYGLRVRLINVSFHSAMEAAGRVELGPSDEFFVEVQSDLKAEPSRLAAVLAHEVGHIALHRARVSLGTDAADEILTDCAAITYGFGILLLDAYEVTERRHGNTIHRVERKLGYLTPEAMGMVVALSTRPAPTAISFKSTSAKRAYLAGRKYLRKYFGLFVEVSG